MNLFGSELNSIGIMGAGWRHGGPSGDAACDADWVSLTEDNRLTTV